jgi:uroporphyrinogen III methyltransferase / synthase
MGIKQADAILDEIMKHGRSADTPAAVIEKGTTPGQRVITATLGTLVDAIRDNGVKPPAIIVIGEVAAIRERLSWFEKRPLFGRTVLVTRARPQASELAEQLSRLGANALEFPTIRIEPPDNFGPLDSALEFAADYDHIVFTSVNGVDAFFGRARALDIDIRDLQGPRIWAIGPATRDALLATGVRTQALPMEFFSKALAQALSGEVRGQKVLLPRADIAPADLRVELEEAGASVLEVTAYCTVIEPDTPRAALDAIAAGAVDYVTFTSSSTVRYFMKKIEGLDTDKFFERARVISIGPTTSQTARGLGLTVHAEATEFTIPGVVRTLLNDVNTAVE